MFNQKIKIYYVLGPLGYGGAERLVVDLVKNLDKNIFLPKVFCIRAKGVLVTELEKNGVEVVVVPKKNKFGFDTIVTLAKIFKKEKPDIVHTHLFVGDTWGRLAAVLARVPLIICTEHNMNMDEGFLKRQLKLVLSFFTDKIFAVSKAVKMHSIKKDKISAKKIQVIYNGIDINKFKQSEFKFNLQNPVITCVGRLEEQKGQRYLIATMPEVIKKYPTACLWLVGSGSQQVVLENQIKNLNLNNNVSLIPATETVSDILNKTDIFVFPSLWEGLGIVLLEALASFKPVVASQIPAVDEIIMHNKTGLLAIPKDSHDLAQKILMYLDDQKLARALAQAGQQMIIDNFDIKKITSLYQKEYLNLYEGFTNQ